MGQPQSPSPSGCPPLRLSSPTQPPPPKARGDTLSLLPAALDQVYCFILPWGIVPSPLPPSAPTSGLQDRPLPAFLSRHTWPLQRRLSSLSAPYSPQQAPGLNGGWGSTTIIPQAWGGRQGKGDHTPPQQGPALVWHRLGRGAADVGRGVSSCLGQVLHQRVAPPMAQQGGDCRWGGGTPSWPPRSAQPSCAAGSDDSSWPPPVLAASAAAAHPAAAKVPAAPSPSSAPLTQG